MDKKEFKKILFKVAFCAMTCDGDIDDREIEELKLMNDKTTYFTNIDLSEELKQLVSDFKNKGAKVIEEFFELLRNVKLNPIQELLLLEIALRIIYADKRIDENEVKFINFLRSKLRVHDEIIIERFGELDILHTNEYSKNIYLNKAEMEFVKNIKLPKMSELTHIDLTNKK
jgi:uncharacterized tellurite resistance protein B-like protein